MTAMRLHPTPLPGLTLVETEARSDERGSFVRIFCEQELAPIRPGLHFPQANLSTTRLRGTIRGMHFQRPPAAEAKLIRCLRGRVFDVAVDLREGSRTFLRWHAVELSSESSTQVFIPEGFAHGFQALTDDVQLLYFHTASWQKGCEGGLRPDDPHLGIAWPLPPTLMSEKDRSAPLLDAGFSGLTP